MLTRSSSVHFRGLLAAFLLTFTPSLFALERGECQSTPMQIPTEATAFGKLAEDFSLMTRDGLFRMSENWNPCEVYVFFKTFTVPQVHPLQGLSKLTNAMWQSKFDLLLQYSPRNAHYFFVSQNSDPAQRLKDQDSLEAHLNEALAVVPAADREHWRKRIHIVNDDLTGSAAAWIGRLGVESFVIDRFQKVNALGVGVYSPLIRDGDFLKLAMEANFYNFQWERERDLAARKDDKIVEAFAAESVQAGWQAFGGKINEVEFPNATAMANFDRLAIDLELTCDKPQCIYDQGLYYYDRVVEVFLCRDASDSECDIEVGRWVTPFGLGGRWVHDISPLLALFHKGGKHRLRFHTVDRYNVSLKFRLGSSRSEEPKPFAYQELYRGGKFNEAYNVREPIAFSIPDGTKRVEIVSVTTGHGWGRDAENCAEFCVTDHEWVVNQGPALVHKLENAGNSFACFLSTGLGVIPNQPGTWYFGRSGWCPGLEVKPKVWDISKLVDFEGVNQLRYRGLYKGADYSPIENPQGVEQGYAPEINLRSYLVFSK